jgi:hypothetical protein
MYIDMNDDGTFDNSERVAGYGWNMNGNKTLNAGTPYNVIYMAREYGGGQGVWWAFTPPSGGERIVNPADPNQVNMWSAIVPPAYFSHLTMAPNTDLILGGSGHADFGSAILSDGATITGNVRFDSLLAVNSKATVDGELTISNGMVYEWDITPSLDEVVEVMEDLFIDKSFTLRLFGAGGSLSDGDAIPIFLYNADLYIGGALYDPVTNPLDYVIDIGNLEDPNHLYLWDICDASLQVLSTPDPGIYLTGLTAILVPEPTTLVVLGGGLACLALRRRKERRK